MLSHHARFDSTVPELATVTTYRRTDEAVVAQHALETAGIDSVVEEARVAKLRVEPVDALRAGDVLNEHALPDIGEADEEFPDASQCALCNSRDVRRALRLAPLLGLVALAIGIAAAVDSTEIAFFAAFAAAVFALVADRWRCGDCGATWG
jgi:hypothetical protein